MGSNDSIDVRAEDLGPFLLLPCTRCDAARWFHLRPHSAFAQLFGFSLFKPTAYSLHCEECEFAIDLSEADSRKALEFLPVVRDRAAGLIQESEFIAKLTAAGFRFLAEISAANTNWKCPGCGEEVPGSMTACWNCGVEQAVPATGAAEEEPSTPTLDRALNDKGAPFGQLGL